MKLITLGVLGTNKGRLYTIVRDSLAYLRCVESDAIYTQFVTLKNRVTLTLEVTLQKEYVVRRVTIYPTTIHHINEI